MVRSNPAHSPRPRPRVALFPYSLGCGGVERIALNLARGLIDQGFRVDILTPEARGEYLPEVPAEARLVELGRNHGSKLYRLVRYLRRNRPHTVLAFMYPQNELSLLANALSGSRSRIIVSVHSMLSGQEQIIPFRWPLLATLHATWVRRLSRHAYPLADGIIAVSRGAARELAELARLPMSRIEVIYNPVISPRVLRQAEQPLDHPWFQAGQAPVILSVGRLHPVKDLPTLIRAFDRVRRQQAARLVILGSGPEEARLRTLIDQLGLAEDVDLLGDVANPYPYMAAASMLALSPRFDALGVVMVEALALGLPVVATDCPSGPREILKDGAYGHLVPVGDSAAMAAAMRQVMAGDIRPVDPEWLTQFSESTVVQTYIDRLSDQDDGKATPPRPHDSNRPGATP